MTIKPEPILNQKNNFQSNNQSKLKVILAIIFLIILIVLLVFIGFWLKNSSTSQVNLNVNSNTDNSQRQLAEKRDRPQLGNQTAKLVIVEFSDFQCPVCQAQFPIIREIIERYKDQILFIYRQYPIINENSLAVSQASLCAFEQDKFWAMHDRLFLKPSNNFSADDLQNIGRQSGLDMEQFNNCLTDEKYKNMALSDAQDALALKAPGTPTFFVNGHKLSGLVSQEEWDKIISQSLKLLQ